MDPKLFKLARQLQTKLSRIDDQADSDAFDSVHALLIEFIGCIENAIPGLKAQRLLAQAKVNREEATRLLKEMKLGRELPDERDIIEKIKRILGDEGPGDPVGVPAKRKPGPKGIGFDNVERSAPGAISRRSRTDFRACAMAAWITASADVWAF
jgi:hypothetical protein